MMHDFDDVPKMAEKGTSVSPGLRSFISVETTKVLTLRSVLSFLSVYFCGYSCSSDVERNHRCKKVYNVFYLLKTRWQNRRLSKRKNGNEISSVECSTPGFAVPLNSVLP